MRVSLIRFFESLSYNSKDFLESLIRLVFKNRCIIHEKPHPKSDFFAHKSGTSRTILNGKSKLPALSSDFFAGSSVVSR